MKRFLIGDLQKAPHANANNPRAALQHNDEPAGKGTDSPARPPATVATLASFSSDAAVPVPRVSAGVQDAAPGFPLVGLERLAGCCRL